MNEPPVSPPPPPPAAPGPRKRARGWPFHWVLLYTRGLIVNQHLRRQTMFYVVIAAMVMFFAGDWFVADWHHHPLRFAAYWLVCGWLTVLAALLAIYDLLLLRVQNRLLRRELQKRMLEREMENGKPEE